MQYTLEVDFCSHLMNNHRRSRLRLQFTGWMRFWVLITLYLTLLQAEKEKWIWCYKTGFFGSGNILAARWGTVKQPISSQVTHSRSVPIFSQERVMFVMTLSSTLHILAQYSQNICPFVKCMPYLWNNQLFFAPFTCLHALFIICTACKNIASSVLDMHM